MTNQITGEEVLYKDACSATKRLLKRLGGGKSLGKILNELAQGYLAEIRAKKQDLDDNISSL